MTNPPQPARKQTKARALFAILLVVIVAVIAYRWWWGRSHVATDNAQLEGHIVPIAARVGGYVLKVPVTDNQTVKRDAVLVEIDPRDYAAKAALAEAEYQQALSAAGKTGQPGIALAQIGAAQASAAAAAAQIHAIEAQITEARANVDKARRDLVRVRELANQKMYSAAALDASETAVKTAEAHVRALEAQLGTTRESASAAGQQVNVSSAGLQAAQAKVAAAEANLQLARNQLVDARVAAPVDGVVSKKAVEPGQMIQAGQTLMYLVPTHDLWVTANLKETEVRQVAPGQTVEIEVDAYADTKLKGRVDSFSPATGARFTLLPPDNSTGNFTKVVQRVPVKIALDALPAEHPLRPGMSVNVTISTR
ncbi:HlyD family secretion protein [Propionivibrio soli]|uniref:HlyD family secretion protein n=1 Tax=Propionivibrio soli TaxID=2976531 RepID=UPI0021E7EDC3|nr:HlyD family secretion protein [Propionivibrio soli]